MSTEIAWRCDEKANHPLLNVLCFICCLLDGVFNYLAIASKINKRQRRPNRSAAGPKLLHGDDARFAEIEPLLAPTRFKNWCRHNRSHF